MMALAFQERQRPPFRSNTTLLLVGTRFPGSLDGALAENFPVQRRVDEYENCDVEEYFGLNSSFLKHYQRQVLSLQSLSLVDLDYHEAVPQMINSLSSPVSPSITSESHLVGCWHLLELGRLRLLNNATRKAISSSMRLRSTRT